MELIKDDNGWRVRVSYYDAHHKRKYKVRSGIRTKNEAKQIGYDLEHISKEGGNLGNHNFSFVDYFKNWYTIFRKPTVSDATNARYQYTINVLTSYFGDEMLRKITTTKYQEFLNWFGLGDDDSKPHAKQTIGKINSHVKAAVRNALNDKIINKDFTLNTHLVYDSDRTREIKYLNYADAGKLYNYTLGHLSNKLGYDVTGYMVLTALLTGMREQEVAGLTWSDIDFKNGKIDINKTWNWKKRDFGPTKNPTSTRVVTVDLNLLNILRKLRYQQRLFLKSRDLSNDKNLLFFSRYQRVPSSKALNDALTALLQKAKISQALNFHGLRHTHASILLYQGMSIAYISHRLGHKSIETTTRTYLHIIQELEHEEDDKTKAAMLQLGSHADWNDFAIEPSATLEAKK